MSSTVCTHTVPPRFAASEGMSFALPAGGVLQSDNIPDWFDTPKRQAIESFKLECYELSGALVFCFAVRLGLERSYFHGSHLQKAPGNTLKMIKYPRVDKSGTDIPRLSEHSDWGSVTFVFADRAGLEIRDPNHEWFHIPVVSDGIVVNIGNALSLWTDRALKSTMHRIIWTNLSLDQDRYSIAYFTNPNLGEYLRHVYPKLSNPVAYHIHPSPDAPLQIPRSSSSERNRNEQEEPAITYQDYYKVRLRLTYGSLKDGSFNQQQSALRRSRSSRAGHGPEAERRESGDSRVPHYHGIEAPHSFLLSRESPLQYFRHSFLGGGRS